MRLLRQNSARRASSASCGLLKMHSLTARRAGSQEHLAPPAFNRNPKFKAEMVRNGTRLGHLTTTIMTPRPEQSAKIAKVCQWGGPMLSLSPRGEDNR